ncbi:hypothetical protein LK08_19595 [Streptomyces sp. MUSC 125]|nr:hypothetical protein LK08_19595 [Streptomyces sp. MUSC 125]
MKVLRTLKRLAQHEMRVYVSLALWLVRRPQGVSGGRAFGYTRGQGATTVGLVFVWVVEAVGVAVMLRDWPTAHEVTLVLDVYTVLLVVGLQAACTVRPHVLTPQVLRVRYGVHVDLRIPLSSIASVRRETRTTHEPAEDALDLAVGSQTSITLELAEPVTHTTFLGRPRDVRVVRLHADDPGLLVQALTRP